jgi:SAM-dependent methyltransferase
MSPFLSASQARAVVSAAYTAVKSPQGSLAALVYEDARVAGLPNGAVEMALGVGDVVKYAQPHVGEAVLDVGCGAGLDLLLAARAVGQEGRVIALDMTPAMIDRARTHATEMGLSNAEFCAGVMEEIPLPDESVDVVLCNGVLNLSTRQSRALAEMFRVLKPGGRLALAELVRPEELPEEIRKDPAAFAG